MCLNPPFSADLVTFIEKIRNGKLHFLCRVACTGWMPGLSNYTLFLLLPVGVYSVLVETLAGLVEFSDRGNIDCSVFSFAIVFNKLMSY